MSFIDDLMDSYANTNISSILGEERSNRMELLAPELLETSSFAFPQGIDVSAIAYK